MLLKWTRPVQATSIPECRNSCLNLKHENKANELSAKSKQNNETPHQPWKKWYLFKLHNRLRSPGRIQWKNVKRRINLGLFLDISSGSNNLNTQNSLLLIFNMNGERKPMPQVPNFTNKMKMKLVQIKADLRSYFFDLLSLINCTKHFK